MQQVSSIILYSLAFISTFVQVVFLITFLEKRKEIKTRTGVTSLRAYPAVTIVVPCWNEETTLRGTVESLLALDYPKDKLNFFLVDDGSTDGTWEIMRQYENFGNIDDPRTSTVLRGSDSSLVTANSLLMTWRGGFIQTVLDRTARKEQAASNAANNINEALKALNYSWLLLLCWC